MSRTATAAGPEDAAWAAIMAWREPLESWHALCVVGKKGDALVETVSTIRLLFSAPTCPH